jgi:hypothetical protein
MPSGSFSQWLGLREAADAAARSTRVTEVVARSLRHANPLRALDLATGTGANLRYLGPRLENSRQDWLAVDRDRALLGELASRLLAENGRFACRAETREIDLSTLQKEIFATRDLVTASALLDLVSERWLRDLAARCRDAGAVVLLALTYDGRWECVPAEPDDVSVRELFNQHQRSAPGLGGPALGPAAADAAERALAQEGFAVERAASDWTLSAGSRWGAELQRRLIEGWAEAAAEIAPDRRDEIDDWLARRLAHVDAGRSRIVVGHQDVAGIPKLTT